jgi:hypothetical protein
MRVIVARALQDPKPKPALPDAPRALPDFLIVGAMKCATSSLHAYLDLHPEIGMAVAKETDFFLTPETVARGPDWYAAQFPSAAIRGEASPNYSKRDRYPGVPERIALTVPRAKLLYLVRDPVARSVSHYLHNVAFGFEHRPAEIALDPARPNGYLQASRYAYQLAAFLDHFPRVRVRVLEADDLKERQIDTLRAVFGFLSADPDFTSERFAERFHASESKTREKSWANWLRTRVPGLAPTVKAALPEALRRRLTHTGLPEVRLTERQSADLRAFFADDQAALAAQADLWLRPDPSELSKARRATA